MQHYAVLPTEEELPRIVTAGMGTLGGIVVRQVRRTLGNAECIHLEDRDKIVHDFPALGKKVHGADCVFIVVDPLNREALNTANWLARKMIAERALVVILTSEPAEHPNGGMLSGDYPPAGYYACSCIVVSPLSINPLSEDVLPMFGKEMLAAYLINHTIETIVRMMTDGLIGIDFEDARAVINAGGTLRLGIGINTYGDAGNAIQGALESLARQGVDISLCRGILACISATPNMKMEDFEEITTVLRKSLDEETLEVLGLLIDDASGRTVKVTLLCG